MRDAFLSINAAIAICAKKVLMNSNNYSPVNESTSHTAVLSRLTAVMTCLLVSGCASEQMGVVRTSMSTGQAPPPPGSVVLTCPETAARFSFDKAKGRTMYAGDEAATAARSMLDPPHVDHAQLEWASGPIGFVAAPFAAAAGAIRGHNAVLGAEQLSGAEADLTQAMARMAEQDRFRSAVLQVAQEKTHCPILLLDSSQAQTIQQPVGAILETSLEELRLKRMASGDTSFALQLKARARMIASDGSLICERKLEYETPQALFLDWTSEGSLERVAETGFQELAAQLLKEVFGSPDEALLVGTGQHVASHPGLSPIKAAYKPTAYPAMVGKGSGAIGIYSTGTVSRVFVQKVYTKEEATDEALSDVAWALDGLHESRNSVVQVSACAVAVPMSLWKQTVAAVRGLSPKKYALAEKQLSAATREMPIHQELARQVAQQLAPRTAQPVSLVRKPLPEGAESDTALMRCLSRGTLSWLPKGQTKASYLTGQGA